MTPSINLLNIQHSSFNVQHSRIGRIVRRILPLALALALVAPSAHAWPFGPRGDSNAEKKANIRKQRDEMLAQLYAADPGMKKVIKHAVGYATFKQVNVNLLLLATGNGYGVVVDKKSRKETFMRMGSLGGGIGAGVKDVRVIFVFHDAATMKQFVEEGWQFGGQADAAAKYQDTGAAAEQNVKGAVSFRDGTVAASSSTDVRAGTATHDSSSAALTTRGNMEVYQFTESGVALQATVSGTKYWQDSKLNP
jgi:lipid-binding SYLF domain-containing protein